MTEENTLRGFRRSRPRYEGPEPRDDGSEGPRPRKVSLQSSKPIVFVGMSGGVDSSVSALLLKEQGYRVVGVYMKNWSQDLPGMKCPWAEDLADAKRVAVKLGIDFEVWDFEKEYHDKVVDYMLSEFRKGNTPNPDIMCNQEIKFKLFYEKAMEAGADFIATGHYARVGVADNVFSRNISRFSSPETYIPDGPDRFAREAGGSAGVPAYDVEGEKVRSGKDMSDRTPTLLRAVDDNKDQTYFLYRISEEALARTIFPIGGMLKPEVKKLAKERGLHNAYKKESMGVCFVGEVGMKDFLKEYIETEPGEIREVESEKVLGYHEGAVFYTVGQRHGLYLSGVAGEVNDGMPYYVVKKDIPHNIIYVSKNLNDANLWTKTLRLRDIFVRNNAGSWAGPAIAEESKQDSSRDASSRPSLRGSSLRSLPSSRMPLEEPVLLSKESPSIAQVSVRLRHRAELIPAEFDGETLYFEHEVKRPASGQSAVLYDGEVCLGGGVIV